MAQRKINDINLTTEGKPKLNVAEIAAAFEVLQNNKVAKASSLVGGGEKTRPKCKPHPIRRDIINDCNVVAVHGWNTEPENMIWTALDAKRYYIDKELPEHGWELHHKRGVAHIQYCKEAHFKHCLLEVREVLFLGNISLKIKASYNLLAIVYSEVRLH